jgi:hypothetical protein
MKALDPASRRLKEETQRFKADEAARICLVRPQPHYGAIPAAPVAKPLLPYLLVYLDRSAKDPSSLNPSLPPCISLTFNVATSSNEQPRHMAHC